MNKMIKTAQLCAMALIGVAVLTTSCDKKDELMTVDKLADPNFVINYVTNGFIKGDVTGSNSEGSSFDGLNFTCDKYVSNYLGGMGTVGSFDTTDYLTSDGTSTEYGGYSVNFDRVSLYTKNSDESQTRHTASFELYFDKTGNFIDYKQDRLSRVTLDLNWFDEENKELKHISTDADNTGYTYGFNGVELTVSEDGKTVSVKGEYEVQFNNSSTTTPPTTPTNFAKVVGSFEATGLKRLKGGSVDTKPLSLEQ